MTTLPPQDVFLTVAEIATRLQVNPQTVRNWIARGQLPAVRVGRRVRVRQIDLDRFIAAGTTRRRSVSPDAVVAEGNGSDRRADPASATSGKARDGFIEAAAEFVRALNSDRPDHLSPALRTLARSAERWAELLELPG